MSLPPPRDTKWTALMKSPCVVRKKWQEKNFPDIFLQGEAGHDCQTDSKPLPNTKKKTNISQFLLQLSTQDTTKWRKGRKIRETENKV